MADTNDLIKWGIAGLAAYYLYEKGYLSFLGLTPASTGALTTTTNVNTSVPAGQSTSATPDLKTQVAQAATLTTVQAMVNLAKNDYNYQHNNGLMNFDQWNYYYQQVRGVAGPAFEDINSGHDRSYLMSINEWYANVQNAPGGLAGLGLGYVSSEGIRSGGGANSFERALKFVM